jgi:hypothetical protein
MATPEFPDDGVLWRGWDDETFRIIDEKKQPILLFVRDTDPFVWPFLRETFKAMPKNAKFCVLMNERCTALYTEIETLPEELKQLGAGSRYHIAILSPYGLTPIVTVDPTGGGKPAEIVERIVVLLERVLEAWG